MNMINPGSGNLEIAKRIEQLEQENEELKNRIYEIEKAKLLPFVPSEGINYLTVFKTGVCVLIRNFIISANTKLPTVIHPAGYTYYIIGKIDGGNPFGFSGASVIEAGTIFLKNSSGGLDPLGIYFYYDGTNTYLIQTAQYVNTVSVTAISVGQSTIITF